MKNWAPDHPKAKLMARKRGAILAAAKDIFLRLGYEGASFVGHLELFAEYVLAAKGETKDLGQAEHKRLGRLFIDRLFGADMLRILLGLGGLSKAEQMRRAERAAAEIMAEISAAQRHATAV